MEDHTAVRYKHYESPERLVVSTEWGTLKYTKIKGSTEIRQKGRSVKSDLSEVSKGTLVKVLDAGDNWSQSMYGRWIYRI